MDKDFIDLIEARGFLNQITDREALAKRMKQGVLPCYIGYDATAPSLHIGSLISIMLLRWYQQAGHKPIILMGGGTTKVGDPSGKDQSRQLLSMDAINHNINGIKQVFGKFIQFGDGANDAIMVNNADWLDKLQYIDFLRDYGRHFSINRMLGFESVKARLEREQTLSFLEFNYMILQAYDFVELAKRYGCALQMGGSDQWGNIVNGIELGRRVENLSLYGLTTPLLTTSSGAKMGKSANGAIWLNQDMLSPYDYWQFWRNSEDGDVGRFLKLFTQLPLDEIARLEALEGNELNEAKKILADHATALCHGQQAADEAHKTADDMFGKMGASDDLPKVTLNASLFEQDQIGLLRVIVEAGFAKTNSDARRAVAQGAIKLDQQPVNDPKTFISKSQLSDQKPLMLSFGRKKHILLILE
ncbi:MAG: tyrosine--tRNA ligase [Alphaproteobacteria bacterium]